MCCHETEVCVGAFRKVRFCVDRLTGTVLSANHSAWEWDAAGHRNITVVAKSILAPTGESVSSYFDVPDVRACVDLRALPQVGSVGAEAEAEAGVEGSDPATTILVNDPMRIDTINRAAGGVWTAAPSRRCASHHTLILQPVALGLTHVLPGRPAHGSCP